MPFTYVSHMMCVRTLNTWLSCNIICIRVYHSNKDNNNAKYPFIKTVENELNPASNDRAKKKTTWKNAYVYKQHMKHIFFCLSLIIVIGLVYSMYTVNRYYAQLLTVIFMLILMVSPSLNPKSSSCFGAAFSWSIFSWFFTHLKWSWSATFKSNESDRSPNPRPKNAVRPGTEKKTMTC